MAPTAEMVGISAAETMLTAANKASERALVNMMTVEVSDREGCSNGYAEELILGFEWVGGMDEAKTRSLMLTADRRSTAAW